jgi:glycosyltransferase involved in cell wall biosynthesis
MKQSLPKISIIIPNLNYGMYLEECLNSIISQSYPYLEIIVIDGGSTDNSLQIIEQYKKHLFYSISEKDNGQSDAINKGFTVATGEYIYYLNSDDCLLPGALSKIFKNHNFKFQDFIYSKVISGENIKKAKQVKSKFISKFKSYNILKFFYSQDYIIPSQTVFIRKEFLLQNNLSFLDTSLNYCMDMEWYYRISKFKPKTLFLNEYLAFFRINTSTKTGSQTIKMQVEARKILFENLFNETEYNQSILLKMLLLNKILNKFYQNQMDLNKVSIVRVINLTFPISLTNKKFLGLIKQKVVK